MDTGLLPPRAMGLMPADARALALRAHQVVAAGANPRLHALPAAIVVAALLLAWLVNSIGWCFGDARAMVATCAASLVATVTIAVGWTTEPEEVQRWGMCAIAGAFASALPMFGS